MTAKIVGITTIDYVSKKTGKPVLGKSLQIVRKPTPREESTVGLVATDVFISSSTDVYDSITNALIDKTVSLHYESDGRYSYLNAIEVHKDA